VGLQTRRLLQNVRGVRSVQGPLPATACWPGKRLLSMPHWLHADSRLAAPRLAARAHRIATACAAASSHSVTSRRNRWQRRVTPLTLPQLPARIATVPCARSACRNAGMAEWQPACAAQGAGAQDTSARCCLASPARRYRQIPSRNGVSHVASCLLTRVRCLLSGTPRGNARLGANPAAGFARYQVLSLSRPLLTRAVFL
jgi:hypothetical protein